jgi:hypothetical protein
MKIKNTLIHQGKKMKTLTIKLGTIITIAAFALTTNMAVAKDGYNKQGKSGKHSRQWYQQRWQNQQRNKNNHRSNNRTGNNHRGNNYGNNYRNDNRTGNNHRGNNYGNNHRNDHRMDNNHRGNHNKGNVHWKNNKAYCDSGWRIAYKNRIPYCSKS